MSKPTVDIIIPTYNSLTWLKQTVQSVLDQSFRDFQLYIIDDGSTDDTATYVRHIEDKRVHYTYQENRGQASARNLGIQRSHAPFVAFLDADDIWYPKKLEKQLEIMTKNHQVGLVYGYHYIINDEDIITGSLYIEKRGHLFEELCKGNIIAGSASMAMVRRSVLEQAGFFREDFVNGEDWELWLRISRLCTIDYVPEIIAAIRQHGQSTQANTQKMAEGLLYVFEVMKKEYSLTKSQRIYIASYCLFNAARTFYALGERGLARKTTIRLLRENPRAFIELGNWKVHVASGPYYASLLGNPFFDFTARCLHKVYRVTNRGFRILRRYWLIVMRKLRLT